MSLAGNLDDLGLGEILQIISLSRKSGILVLRSREHEGNIVFRHGQIVRATSSSYQQQLGEILIEKGFIGSALLEEALLVQKREEFKERLGKILTSRFEILPASIEESAREQIINVVSSFFSWTGGAFDFSLNDNVEVVDDVRIEPGQLMLVKGINPRFSTMEGTRVTAEKRQRRKQKNEPATDREPAANSGTGVENLSLQEQASLADSAMLGRRIIVVDDDAGTLEVITSFLHFGPYQVSAFEKGAEALIEVDRLYKEGERPTILIDLIMPRMDGSGILGGLELVEIVHATFKGLPVLAMADFENNEAEEKVVAMGCPFILKPRKDQVFDDGNSKPFFSRLSKELEKTEMKSRPVAGNDSVNVGNQILLEIGESPAPATPSDKSTGISLLGGMLNELKNPALRGGIILLVLRFASEFMSRAIIFSVNNKEILGLGQFGINDGAADAKVRNLKIPTAEQSIFSAVIGSQLPSKMQPDDSKWNRYLFEQLGGSPAEFFLGPVVSEGKVVAILYGDNLLNGKPIEDTDSLEIFLSQAGMAMEKVLLAG